MEKETLKLLNPEALLEFAEMLVDKLDKLDEEDFFGSEGWRHYLKINQVSNQ